MKYFVILRNGQVLDGPFIVSSSPSDSPNIEWSDDQMAKNNFAYVDLDHDKYSESIDYENPVIDGMSVSYPRIPAPKENAINELRNEKLSFLKKKTESIILSKYSVQDEVSAALGLHSEEFVAVMVDDLRSIYQVYDLAKDELAKMTDKEQIDSYNPEFPRI